MKAIQSLWTKPYPENKCGYSSQKDLFACTELSAKLLKKSGCELVFYTDKKGFKLMPKKLKNLYDSIVVNLDEINSVNTFNWGFSKLFVYAQQESSFFHVDNDVFIWEGLPTHFFSSLYTDCFFQGKEVIQHHGFYNNAVNELPKTFFDGLLNEMPDFAVNCGVAGFNDLSLIPQYFDNAIKFIDKNKDFDFKGSVHRYHQCILFEQLFLTQLIQSKNVQYILDENVNLVDIPYTHLIASSKKNPCYISRVHERLATNNLSIL
jgi:hypothetical protein